jgi:hypothetical protein
VISPLSLLLASIPRLCGSIVSPFYVSGSIPPVIINSIEFVLCTWPFTHVDQEVFEFAPALTNLDASLTIIWITIMIRVTASIEHSPPHGVNRITRSSMRSNTTVFGMVYFEASARLRVVVGQHIQPDNTRSTAIALQLENPARPRFAFTNRL